MPAGARPTDRPTHPHQVTETRTGRLRAKGSARLRRARVRTPQRPRGRTGCSRTPRHHAQGPPFPHAAWPLPGRVAAPRAPRDGRQQRGPTDRGTLAPRAGAQGPHLPQRPGAPPSTRLLPVATWKRKAGASDWQDGLLVLPYPAVTRHSHWPITVALLWLPHAAPGPPGGCEPLTAHFSRSARGPECASALPASRQLFFRHEEKRTNAGRRKTTFFPPRSAVHSSLRPGPPPGGGTGPPAGGTAVGPGEGGVVAVAAGQLVSPRSLAEPVAAGSGTRSSPGGANGGGWSVLSPRMGFRGASGARG